MPMPRRFRPAFKQRLEPDVDHHRIDDEEDRDRGQIADRARVGLGRGLEKVADDEPEDDGQADVDQHPVVEMLLEGAETSHCDSLPALFGACSGGRASGGLLAQPEGDVAG